jgi:hypothetical protein
LNPNKSKVRKERGEKYTQGNEITFDRRPLGLLIRRESCWLLVIRLALLLLLLLLQENVQLNNMDTFIIHIRVGLLHAHWEYQLFSDSASVV